MDGENENGQCHKSEWEMNDALFWDSELSGVRTLIYCLGFSVGTERARFFFGVGFFLSVVFKKHFQRKRKNSNQ